ncbi:hypothetical protein NDU88_002998 [Pleurodeles waltl]|uniref:Uncharacterized protein n=1 Tax=Pleurodeles waltl TaxID=8319 RepID=A0AAV7REF2_PLEWA|nr:hypothetical protein NDU88_002998 [Pleurodeles waltl]
MYCRCRLYPGTRRQSSQSPWTSGVKGAAATDSHAREDRKGKQDRRREGREERKKQDCGGRKTDGWHGNWKTARTRTEAGTRRKVPGAIGNTCRRRTAKLPATLQEKRGTLRCDQKLT